MKHSKDLWRGSAFLAGTLLAVLCILITGPAALADPWAWDCPGKGDPPATCYDVIEACGGALMIDCINGSCVYGCPHYQDCVSDVTCKKEAH